MNESLCFKTYLRVGVQPLANLSPFLGKGDAAMSLGMK
jgi:hypothetical protein